MIRLLVFIVPLALAIYAVVDCIQTEKSEVRNLPKMVWILLILLFWIIGPIAWLLAGRPKHDENGVYGRRLAMPTGGPPEHKGPRHPVGPDDDPAFLAELSRGNTENKQTPKKRKEDPYEHREPLPEEQPYGDDEP